MSTAFNPGDGGQQPDQPEPGNTGSQPNSEQKENKKIGCGCGLAILLFIGLMMAFGGDDEGTDQAETTTATTSEDKPAPAPDEGKQDAMPWLESQFGMTPSEAIVADPTSWYGYVSDAYTDKGNLHVLLQVDRKADKELGEQAAKALANFVSFSDDPVVSDVDWAIAENGVGEIIAQESVK